jgi:hypothetical protein
MRVFAKDLSAFAIHAKRSTISPADVFLAARKDRNLVKHLKKFKDLYDSKRKRC